MTTVKAKWWKCNKHLLQKSTEMAMHDYLLHKKYQHTLKRIVILHSLHSPTFSSWSMDELPSKVYSFNLVRFIYSVVLSQDVSSFYLTLTCIYSRKFNKVGLLHRSRVTWKQRTLKLIKLWFCQLSLSYFTTKIDLWLPLFCRCWNGLPST